MEGSEDNPKEENHEKGNNHKENHNKDNHNKKNEKKDQKSNFIFVSTLYFSCFLQIFSILSIIGTFICTLQENVIKCNAKKKKTVNHYQQADMQKDNFFTQTRLEPKLFYPKKCVNQHKSEFANKAA